MFQILPTVQEISESFSESPKSVHHTSAHKTHKQLNFFIEKEFEKSLNSNSRKNVKKHLTRTLKERPEKLNSKLTDNKPSKILPNPSKKKGKNSLLALGKNKENNDVSQRKESALKAKHKDLLKPKLKTKPKKYLTSKISSIISKGEKPELVQTFRERSASDYLNKIKVFTEFNRITENSLKAMKVKQKEIFNDLSIKTFPCSEKKAKSKRSLSCLILPSNKVRQIKT